MQNIEPEVRADAARIVGGILRGMRRRGLPANVDADDLRQEGMIAIVTAERVDTAAHAATIAKHAMLDFLRRETRRNQTFTSGNTAVTPGAVSVFEAETGAGGRSRDAVMGRRRRLDPFFALAVDDGKAYRPERARKQQGEVLTLAARHREWERERRERWGGWDRQ